MLLLKTISWSLTFVFAISSIGYADGFMIDSKSQALNRIKARQMTYNESYPGGSTTQTTTTTPACPPIQTCSAVEECPTCPPEGLPLVAIVTPIVGLFTLGLGIALGAGCMRRHMNRSAAGNGA